MFGTVLERLPVWKDAAPDEGSSAEDGASSPEPAPDGGVTGIPDANGRAVDDGADGSTVGHDTIFHLLQNRRRRGVLRALEGSDEQVRLGSIAETIAARECDTEVARLSSQERKRVYVALYQCHLPKMDGAGAIAYNKPRGLIEPGPAFERFRGYLPDREQAGDDRADGDGWLQPLAGLLR